MKRTAVVAGIGLVAWSAWAGPFNQGQVASTAKWVVHADMDTLRQTQIGQFAMEKLAAGDSGAKMAAAAAIFQFDPLRDLSSLTVYGKSKAPEDGVVLVAGAFNEAHLLTLLRANASYQTDVYGGRAIHSWIDENKPAEGRKYGAFHSPRLIAISQGLPMLHEALDVLDGQGATLDVAGSFGAGPAPEAAIFMAGADMAAMRDLSPEASMLSQADTASLTVSERAGRLEGAVLMRARDAQTATNIQAVVQGLAALAQMGQEKAPGLAQLAQSTRISLDGTRVRVEMGVPVAEAIRFMEDKLARQAIKPEAQQP